MKSEDARDNADSQGAQIPLRLNIGITSRIASRLEQEADVAREPSGAVRLKDPGLVLDAWRQEHQFAKHSLVEGHIAARSGDALARFTGNQLAEEGIEYAATSLAAAWQYNRFAAFRIATFFLRSRSLQEPWTIWVSVKNRGGDNVWLVVPNDEGVLLGAAEQDGIVCVHPVQVHLDSKAHPERAAEAAERLRSERLDLRRPQLPAQSKSQP